jgi:hypothetical protein
MRRFQYNKLCVLVVGILLASPGWAQEEQPRTLWEAANARYAEAKESIGQRSFSQSLGLMAQGHAHLKSLQAQWPEFKAEEIKQLLQEMETQKLAIYKLVSQNGLVEYHGKFYSFDQLQVLLRFQKERSMQWMELLRAQEEVRRLKAEHMVAEETKRQVEEKPEEKESRP